MLALFAAKFFIYWTLQAVWIYVTLLPDTVLNGTERNKGRPTTQESFAGYEIKLSLLAL